MQRPSRGHLAILATGAAVAGRYRTVGKAHTAPFCCNGLHALVASVSTSAGCNAAECTDPQCPVHRPRFTPQPKVDPQSPKVANDGGVSWTEYIATFCSSISAGSGVAALLYCAWTLQISEPNEIGAGHSKVNINKLITSAILGSIPTISGAVVFLESRTSQVAKDLDKKIDRTNIDLETQIDRLETKIDRTKIDLETKIGRLETKIDRVMDTLLTLSANVAFLNGAICQKK